MDKKFMNVLILGLGFMLLFTAFQTMGNVEKTVLESIHKDDENFTGDGYTSLAIIYAVFAIFNWAAPSIMSITGPRGAMIIGGLTYCIFIASFLIPRTWLLYLTSTILGLGAAITWTGQGNFLSRCSDSSTISRNSGIFWAMLQASLFFGNIMVYFQFQGKSVIDEETRNILFAVLTVLAILGIATLATLRPIPEEKDETIDSDNELKSKTKFGVILDELKKAGKLFVTRDMLLLSLAFLYTGFELSFYSGVYSPSIGFTTKLGENSKELVGLSGILIGVGEVSGGLLFGLMSSKTSKFGRNPIVLLGFIIHIIAFGLIFINLPDNAPFNDTSDVSFLNPPLKWLALLCSFFLGFADACYNTQIYSILGDNFSKNSAAAFAIFKFTQSLSAATSFVYSSHLGLRAQMAILVVSGIIGTIGFVLVESSNRKRARENKNKENAILSEEKPE